MKAQCMTSENPYEAPQELKGAVNSSSRARWRRVCYSSLLLANASFWMLLVIACAGGGPPSIPEQVRAGVLLLLQITMYTGMLGTLIGAAGWAIAALRRKTKP